MVAGSLNLAALRQANAARQAEWTGSDQVDLAFRGLELSGEVGEACNVVKKLERERRGISGSRATLADLGRELADVVICADLLALHAGVDLAAAIVGKFNETSTAVGLATRLDPDDLADADLRLVLELAEGKIDAYNGQEMAEAAGRLRARFAAILSPGHTDLMVAPENLDAWLDANPPADEPDACIACDVPLKEGDRVLCDVSGGFIHADCCGPERDSYVGADGEPLAPSEPIPRALIWAPGDALLYPAPQEAGEA